MWVCTTANSYEMGGDMGNIRERVRDLCKDFQTSDEDCKRWYEAFRGMADRELEETKARLESRIDSAEVVLGGLREAYPAASPERRRRGQALTRLLERRALLHHVMIWRDAGRLLPPLDGQGEADEKPNPPYEDDRPVFDGPWRSDAKWLPYGRFIINMDVRLKATGVQTRAERVRRISDALHERFGSRIRQRGHDPAEFNRKRLDDVWDAHRAGELDG